jgi:DNA repair protein RecN (Recombination protein N)
MLTDLVVEDLGVIERVEVTLQPGCTALTGETGAGKTLVVAALSLLAGGRADRTLVRSGAAEARVEGRFLVAPDHPAAAALDRHGLAPGAADEVEIILSRTVPGDGRSGRVRINGHLATVGALADIGGSLIEIAGQHEGARIVRPEQQRHALDTFGGCRALAGDTATAVRRLEAARRALEEVVAGERERRRELDVLRYEIEEIEAASPREGEGDELAREAERLEHAEQIATGVARAVELLHGEGGADELLAAAANSLAEVASHDPAAAVLAERLERASIEIVDVAEEARSLTASPDPDALAEIRDRLDRLARLRRKYGDDERAVLDYLERARQRAAEIDLAEDEIATLRDEVEAGEERAASLAADLSAARLEAAALLGAAVAGVLDDLAMPGASFHVSLERRPLYEGGVDEVGFLLAADPGEEPRPLSKVASGGELSRVALALHLLTKVEAARIMVFDEVDAGVGGAAAQSVGRALARLAAESRGQVIVVTHLPQVAAFAEHHLAVEKHAAAGRTTTQVARIEGDTRVTELSRMLAGLPGSDRAREHAQELLELAGTHA